MISIAVSLEKSLLTHVFLHFTSISSKQGHNPSEVSLSSKSIKESIIDGAKSTLKKIVKGREDVPPSAASLVRMTYKSIFLHRPITDNIHLLEFHDRCNSVKINESISIDLQMTNANRLCWLSIEIHKFHRAQYFSELTTLRTHTRLDADSKNGWLTLLKFLHVTENINGCIRA